MPGSGEWYAIWTRSRHEQVVREQLEQKGFEAFLPTLPKWSRWKDRKKKIDWPLFPGYCFARFDAADRLPVLKCNGVVNIISFNGEIAPIPEQEIEGIRRLVAAAVLQPVFRAQRGHARFPDATWDHAFRSGIAAESYAAIVDGSDPFAAQLLALLMGLGSIIVFRMAFDRYGGEAPPPALIAAMIDRVANSATSPWPMPNSAPSLKLVSSESTSSTSQIALRDGNPSLSKIQCLVTRSTAQPPMAIAANNT